jgi:hypothetical protein
MSIALRSKLVVVALVCGCARSADRAQAPATGEPAAGGETAGHDDLVCEKEYVPGHRTRQKVCRKRSDVEHEREANQAEIRGVRPEPTPPPEFGAGGM